MRTVHSEWRKLTSIRMWIGLTIAAVLFTALNVGVVIALSGVELEGAPMPGLGGADQMRALYGSAGASSVFALVLGILAITSEYRHATITATLLATPNRGRLIAAKMAVSAILGAFIGLLCMLATLALVLIGALVKDIGEMVWTDFAAITGGAVLGFAVFAVLGVGFGALIRNQIAAIVAALVWTLLVESLIVALWPWLGKWLPGGALNGVLQAESFGGDPYLAVIPATLVLLGYAAVFAAAASRITMRRDIT